MKRILTSFIFIVLLTVGSLNASAAQTKSFTLNQVETQSNGNTVDRTFVEGNETLHIERQPILTQADFAHAKIMSRNGETIFQATLTETGATTLKEFSSVHLGQKLAVIMNERVLAAPVIRVTLDQTFEMDGFGKGDAEKLVQMINRKNVN